MSCYKVGDKVLTVCIDKLDITKVCGSDFAEGYKAGLKCKIVSVDHSDPALPYEVKFKKPICGIDEIWLPAEWLVPRKSASKSKFKKGDIVYYISTRYGDNGPIKGISGKVVFVDHKEGIKYGVRFKNFKKGHNLDDKLPDESLDGWWCHEDEITSCPVVIEEAKPEIPFLSIDGEGIKSKVTLKLIKEGENIVLRTVDDNGEAIGGGLLLVLYSDGTFRRAGCVSETFGFKLDLRGKIEERV